MDLILGDCLGELKKMPDNSIDSVVTDPPYGLAFMGKEWDNFSQSKSIALGKKSPANERTDNSAFKTRGKPISGWSKEDKKAMENFQKFSEEWAKEVFRVLKPGGYLLSFAASRTYHRMTCAIEDAGFEIRDQIMWVYGSGFPKSHNVSKALSESEEANQWEGWGTALKPAHEPICVARKPLSEKSVAENVLKWGTGAINIDGCRIEAGSDHMNNCSRTFQGGIWKKSGEAPKKITTEAHTQGRWPANFIHDGSEEVVDLFPDTKSGKDKNPTDNKVKGFFGSDMPYYSSEANYGDAGSAARFFYCAKVSKKERGENNNHPTVKPINLMVYLCRLVTPPNGIVLDPFMGSGSTGIAAIQEGFEFVGIEREKEYFDIAKRRIESVTENNGILQFVE